MQVFDKELETTFTPGLRGVKSGVRVPEQVAWPGCYGARQGDTDARANYDLGTLQREWLAKGVDDSAGNLSYALGIRGVRQDERKLVASESSNDVTRAQAAAKSIRHHHQELVACRVAKAIVYQLEVVQV